jgi:hypothetical protein
MNELETRIQTVSSEASALSVVDQVSLTAANHALLRIKQARGDVDEAYDKIIKKAHEAHREAIETKRKYEEPLIQAERFVKGRISAYLQEEDRKRREAEAAAYRAEQERIRLEAEAQRKAEEALKRAEAAEAKGDAAKADGILNRATASIDKTLAAIPAPPPAPAPRPVTAPGISAREVWLFQIVDANLISREYLIPDEVKIRRVVQALKGGTIIPGVRVWSEKQIAARA